MTDMNSSRSDERSVACADAPGRDYIANCVKCGRIIDTREADEGGDTFGSELFVGSWVCSSECWDAAVSEPAPTDEPEPNTGANRLTVPYDALAALQSVLPHSYAVVDRWAKDREGALSMLSLVVSKAHAVIEAARSQGEDTQREAEGRSHNNSLRNVVEGRYACGPSVLNENHLSLYQLVPGDHADDEDEWALLGDISNDLVRQALKDTQPSGWQPIETAPKGEYILLGYEQQGDEMPTGLLVGVGVVSSQGKIWPMNSGDNEKALPSSWMPLPPPPGEDAVRKLDGWPSAQWQPLDQKDEG